MSTTRYLTGCFQASVDPYGSVSSSVGSLASQVRGYDSIRMFASTATLYILFDVPFGIIYLLVMVAIAGPLVALVASVFLRCRL